MRGGYGACFCRHGRNLVELDECRGTSLVSGREVVPVQEFKDGHWCSVAVQVVSEPGNSHGVKFYCWQMRGPGLSPINRFVMGAGGICKNRDKFITPTDRVMRSIFYLPDKDFVE